MMDVGEQGGIFGIFASAFRSIADDIGLFGIAFAILSVLGSVNDHFLAPIDALRANAVIGLITLYLQLLLCFRMARTSGMLTDPPNDRPTEGRYPAAFGQNLLWFVGVGAGMLLLLIPGLILMIRWFVAFPALVVERQGVTDSFRHSWAMTRGASRMIAGVMAFEVLLFLLSLVIVVAVDVLFGVGMSDGAGRQSWPEALLFNSLIAFWSLFPMTLAFAVYRRLRGAATHESVAMVFA